MIGGLPIESFPINELLAGSEGTGQRQLEERRIASDHPLLTPHPKLSIAVNDYVRDPSISVVGQHKDEASLSPEQRNPPCRRQPVKVPFLNVIAFVELVQRIPQGIRWLAIAARVLIDRAPVPTGTPYLIAIHKGHLIVVEESL